MYLFWVIYSTLAAAVVKQLLARQTKEKETQEN